MAEQKARVELTKEEIEELRRSRRARTKFGIFFLGVGLAGFAATLLAMILKDGGVPGGLGILAVCFAMAAVGGGFADPSEIKGLWK